MFKMDVKFMYAFRGLIAFVAFSDFGIAVRAFVENKCIFNEFADDGNVLIFLPVGVSTLVNFI